MTKNESKLLSIQGIAKASAFCLLLSAFSVNAAMAAPAPAGTVDGNGSAARQESNRCGC